MSKRGWYVLDGRRAFAGPLDEPPALDLAKAWLYEDLAALDRRTVVSADEVQRRLRSVRVVFGVRASRGGFKRLPLPSVLRGVAAGE